MSGGSSVSSEESRGQGPPPLPAHDGGVMRAGHKLPWLVEVAPPWLDRLRRAGLLGPLLVGPVSARRGAEDG